MSKSIIHVYNSETFGFADFIRAIYSIHYLAENTGYKYSIAFNHPISAFFDIDNSEYKLTAHNYTELIEKVEQGVELIIVESNYTDHTIPIRRNLIQQYIKPKGELIDGIKLKLKELKLKMKSFVVLHIRVGDNDYEDTSNFIKRIKQAISIIKIKRLPILVMCSKAFIIHKLSGYPGIIFTGWEPCHTADSNPPLISLQHTLIEFYLMQYSNKIYSISGGGFGNGRSGFSYWASKMFNIEFTHLE
jgi:hypothetical protein